MPQTILCADDDRNFCQILARALSEEGYRVETAHDGESALLKARELDPALVILDILLPRRDGFAVLQALRAEEVGSTPRRVVFLSGCTLTPTYQERARALRADATWTKPIPLKQLLSGVAEQVSAAERTRPRPAPTPRPEPARKPPRAARPEPSPAVELAGTLEDVAFPALLHHLHGLRASGVLQLQNGKKKKQIQLREGRPVAVRSNLVNETLGHLLVASGTITWDVMHESLLRVKRGEGLQGQILKAMQMLDEEDLARALHNQAEEKLFEIFAWRKGSFAFHRGARLKSANALTLKRSTANVILDGVQLRTPMEEVDAFLAERSDLHPIPGESPFYQFQEIDLDETAEELLRGCDGRRPISSLGLPAELERRTLYALLVLELLELRQTPVGVARAKRPPSAPRPQASPARPRAAAAPLPAAKRAPAPPSPAPPRAPLPEERPDVDEPIRVELASMAERFRDRDWFGILGVGRNADDEQIRRAYTDLAKRTHPDRFSGSSEAVIRVAEEVFGLISRAYETVGDREGRLRYLRDEASRERDAAELEEGHRALRAELEFQKGEAALRGRRYDVAAEHFREAVEAYPDEGEYHAYYGWAHYLESPDAPGRIKEALERVIRGRKLAPDREKPYLFLGRLYKAHGRLKTAEKMFTRAVQLDPDCVEALRELRLIHMRREKSKGLVRRILRR